MNRRLLAGLATILIMAAIGVTVYMQFYMPQPSGEGRHTGWTMGASAARTETGDWILNITLGNAPFQQTHMCIMNGSTGETILTVMLADITPENGHPDVILNDSNADGRLNTGDSIVLRNTIPNLSDSKVQFILNDKSIVGSFKLSKY